LRTQRIYLETTMFNYYFDSDRDAHADTVRFDYQAVWIQSRFS
jgi:hypothetical protein